MKDRKKERTKETKKEKETLGRRPTTLVQRKLDAAITAACAVTFTFTPSTIPSTRPQRHAVETGSELFGLVLVVVVQKLFLAQHRQAALHAVGERRDVGARDEVGGQVEEVQEHLVAVAGESESKHDSIKKKKKKKLNKI